MDWFSGGIPEAVAYAQSKSAVFCVVILGEDSESNNLKSSLESEPVQTLIRANGFVSIKISAGSQEHQQFSQIYTDARSPSIYCITLGGVPVEIISESLTPPQLLLALERAIQRHKETLGLLSKPPTQSTPIAPNTPRPEATESEQTSSNPQNPSSNSGPNDPQQMSLEERIERAKKLAAAKQALKEAEDAAEARRREQERREAGKGLAEHKRRQDEEEAKKLVEERRKDKREEAELRRRVKEQFAQDRARLAASKAKAGQTNSQAEQEPSSYFSSNTQTLSSSTANNSTQARIQFRLPDGSTHNHSFDPQSPLREVRQYVRDNLLKSGEFNLSVAFPRRQFSTSESENTLKELGLLPSSAILVIPVPSTSIVRMAGSSSEMLFGYFVAIIRVLCSPLAMLYSFFSAAVGGSGANVSSSKQTGSVTKHSNVGKGNILGRNDGSSSSDPGVGSSSGGSQSTSPSNPVEKKEEQKKFGKQEGNIRRLKPNDSDDENATWNGNSTQQM